MNEDRYLTNNGINNINKISDIKSFLLFEHSISNNPIVSICIPTFKRLSELKRAVYSVLNQDANRELFELIIVDNDCDTDGFEIISFLNNNCSQYNVQYFKNEKNVGQLGNWNKCFELSKTNWICMLHDDDEMYKNCVSTMIRVLTKNKTKNIAYIKANYDKANDGIIDRKSPIKRFFEKFLHYKIMEITHNDILIAGNAGLIGAPTCGTLLNKTAFMQIGGYCDKWGKASDAYVPFLLMKDYRVYVTVKPLGIINFGKNESCKDETIKDWLIDYLQFQSFLSSLNNHFCRFNKKYGKAQTILFIQWCLSNQHKNVNDLLNYGFLKDIYKVDENDLHDKKIKKLYRIKRKHNLFKLIVAIFK